MIDIKIDKDVVYVNVEKDGRQFKKVTDLKTFRETVGIVETSYDSGWLPGKTGVKRITKTPNDQKVVYVHPGGRHTVRYTDEWYPHYRGNHGYTEEDYAKAGYPKDESMSDNEYEEYISSRWTRVLDSLYLEGIYPKNQIYEIVVPDAVIIASKLSDANNWTIRLFTLGFNTLLTGREQLYEYPMPNIYSGGGRICWGDYDDEFNTNFEDIRPLQGYFPSFLSSSFNSDLSNGRIRGEDTLLRFWKQMDTMIKDGASDEEVYQLYEDKFRRSSYTVDSFI